MTCRPTTASAAFGRVCSGGTSTTRCSEACARQARRHPALSSSELNARGSTEETACSPLATRTLHFLQVPCPPHVESIATPFQLAPSNNVVPAGAGGSLTATAALPKTGRDPSGG